MSYFFAKHLLLRLPAQSYMSYSQVAGAFLNDSFFLAGIFLSSPLFYAQLEKSNFTWNDLSQKEKHTLQKYVNRICFRPTPFGLFASVSLLEWTQQTSIPPLGDHSFIAHIKPDRSLQLSIGTLAMQRIKSGIIYEVNPTIYRVLQEFRFIRTDVDSVFQKRAYQLQSTEYSVVLRRLLSYCKSGRNLANIIERIIKLANCNPEEGRDYFEFLTDAQILLPRLRPGVTGTEYLVRLAELAEDRALLSAAISLTTDLRGRSIDLQHFFRLSQRIGGLLQKGQAPTAYFNVILENKLVDAGLDVKFQEPLRAVLFALDTLCPADDVPALQRFAADFVKHFEGRRIPLLTALDPECGISYQEPDRESPNPLVETLNIQIAKVTSRLIDWGPVHAYLLDLLLKAERHGISTIDLKTEELVRLRNGRGAFTTLGFSVLFRLVDNQIFVESAGGNNAPALLGRFTLADQAIAEAARFMAKTVEAINPDIIFAEVLQLTDSHTDNINQRESLWSYELPVTASPELAREWQVDLQDLYVQVERGQVYLWSEKHQKFVIPRLTSAYNHSINRLPLFRFLADVPYQYGRNNLNFELSAFFPGLNYYPRVTYRGAIISLATWLIKEPLILQLTQAADTDLIQTFQQIAADVQLPSSFLLAEGDQQLVFYRDRPADISFFAACIRQKKEIVIKELLLDTIESAIVHDDKTRPFCAQFNAYLLPDSPLNLEVSRDFTISGQTVRKFIPGSEWLYLKIYTTKLNAERLLLKIWPLIKRKFANGPIQQWFFVRFEDHAPHVRLRMKIAPTDTGEVLAAFKGALEDHIHQQVIREYQVDVYHRELERYRLGGIDLTEAFFWASSEFTMRFLRSKRIAKVQPYLTAVVSVRDLLKILLPDPVEQKDFTNTAYQAMSAEFSGPKMKVGLDQKFRELKTTIYEAMHDEQFYNHAGLAVAQRRLEKSARKLRQAISGSGDAEIAYIRSILHMHLNRIFTDEPRKQEMLTYFLLNKFLIAETARGKL